MGSVVVNISTIAVCILLLCIAPSPPPAQNQAQQWLDMPDITLDEHGVQYSVYESEAQLSDIMQLMKVDLSEPYSVYTYRYFIHQWPNLCMLVSMERGLGVQLVSRSGPPSAGGSGVRD